MDSGLSIQSLNSILREVIIRSVAAEHLKVSRRINFSGIAASTGIPRGEVARVLKTTPNSRVGKVSRKQQSSTNKILAAWCRDPRFATPTGAPADLRIYGRGPTFERLVQNYGGGIPARAILDELYRKNAVEIRRSQIVRLKKLAVVDRRLTPRVVESFGIYGSELLSGMLQSMQQSEGLVFMKSTSTPGLSAGVFDARQEITIKGTGLLVDTKKILVKASKAQRVRKAASVRGRLSVVIIVSNSTCEGHGASAAEVRRNLRRSP